MSNSDRVSLLLTFLLQLAYEHWWKKKKKKKRKGERSAVQCSSAVQSQDPHAEANKQRERLQNDSALSEMFNLLFKYSSSFRSSKI